MAEVIITAVEEEVSERLLLTNCEDVVTVFLILRFALASSFTFYFLSSSLPRVYLSPCFVPSLFVAPPVFCHRVP